MKKPAQIVFLILFLIVAQGCNQKSALTPLVLSQSYLYSYHRIKIRILNVPTQGLNDSFARNLSYQPIKNGYKLDSDGDGIADVDEVKSLLGLSPNNIYSDGCHLDLVLKQLGVPIGSIACQVGDETDTDGDGLTDKEESLLGSDPHKVDTDGDGISDLLEVVAGTLLLTQDSSDVLYGGRTNYQNVKEQAPVRESQTSFNTAMLLKYLYLPGQNNLAVWEVDVPITEQVGINLIRVEFMYSGTLKYATISIPQDFDGIYEFSYDSIFN